MVPAKLVPLFKPSKELKAQVLGNAQPEESVVK
jgi:nucleoid DNA-binding protein